MQIWGSGERPTRAGPAEYFTGRVGLDPVIQAPEPSRLQALVVAFEPGARTHWHSHPLGQTLLVLTGRGLAQAEGGPRRQLRPGDTVWFAPGEKHWHGAAPENGMTHLAMQEALDGSAVAWMEPVADADYLG
jgi:quercetin dioxygenase-like cupin family protein